jgi:hypothetical protein
MAKSWRGLGTARPVDGKRAAHKAEALKPAG